ncbi:FAD binding domain-containing protein [Bauldia litoralis]|uniref:CO or xanthine dehydrogenase, FAD-binding subunit n=1 Tax=Bauldia litoralis TaxID=665467 RepID=A0A1G6AHN0_9HYPH|nr:FAD binding domain-containing protein [Bauldia litoralis]SDB07836.1 CO or xanthine dehydrogenase, FAD-binding subunit [Bauldia litoralis]
MALDIVKVDSVREAAATIAASGDAYFLAGGTILARVANTGGFPVRTMVLSDGLGLDAIAVDGDTIEIGAAATMTRIAAEPRLAFLRPVAESIGGPAIRNMATVGGNLFARYPYGDFAVALLALDAEVTIEDAEKTRTTGLDDFLASAPAGGIVRALRFKLPPDGAFRFTKVVRKHPHGASVLSIAAVLPETGGKVSNARVAYGAMSERPMRAKAVEGALEGRALDAQTLENALKVATDGCQPQTDPQATDWYRMTVLPVHLKRLLSGEGRF